MLSFYRHLRGGEPKDQALRSAQIEMIKSPASALPVYWASYILNGDWQ
jgi:CHAT domain-containing protein